MFAETYPQLLGIGIDEAAALSFRGAVADVIGRPGRERLVP